jgi:hypothetical protein
VAGVSKWTERDRKRQERQERENIAFEEESQRRREDPTSEERMLDHLDTIENNADRNMDRVFARILKCHITGEEYYP